MNNSITDNTGKNVKKARGDKPKIDKHTMYSGFSIKKLFTKPDLYLAIGFFLALQVSLLLTALAGSKFKEYALLLNITSLVIGVSASVLAFIVINKRQRERNKQRTWLTTLKSLIIIMASMFVANTIFAMFETTPTVQSNQSTIDTIITLNPYVIIFTVVIISPIIEEIVFRELLPYALGSSIAAFVVSSFLFILLHTPNGVIGWTSYSLISMGFLYARLKDNNVYTAIQIHILWNLISVIA